MAVLFLVYLWCIYGVFMVYLWCIYGVFMVYLWCIKWLNVRTQKQGLRGQMMHVHKNIIGEEGNGKSPLRYTFVGIAPKS